MGVITKIEQQKNKNRVNIFIDDSFFCGLEKETAILFGFKSGKIVDEDTILEAIKKSEIKRAFEKIMEYVLTRLYSQKEIEEKLKKKGFEDDIILEAVSKGKEYGYINDNLYAETYISNNSKYSKIVLKTKLIAKGVNKDIIEENLKNLVDEDDEVELCKKYVEKYLKTKNIQNYSDKQKLFASLARKGFNYDVIKKATKNIIDYEYEIF